MKIIGIEIQNDRAIKTFKVALGGKNLTVAGDTGTGKTTSISGLWELIKQAADAIHPRREERLSSPDAFRRGHNGQRHSRVH